MTSYSILDTEEYQDIMDNALGIINVCPRPNQTGVFAYDKKSGVIFEFRDVEVAKTVDNQMFVIFDGRKLYSYSEFFGEYEEAECNMGLRMFVRMFSNKPEPNYLTVPISDVIPMQRINIGNLTKVPEDENL